MQLRPTFSGTETWRMWVFGAFVCSAAELSLGCARTCTDIGCSAEVEVQFAPSITEAGQYRFELDVDGAAATCELAFDPARRGPQPEGCSGLFVRGSDVLVGRDGVTEGAPFEIVGFTLPPAQQVSVAVYRAGELWGERTFAPRYRGVEINGPGCGECPIATEEIALPD